MLFRKTPIKALLAEARRARKDQSQDQLVNILFLDYDGVVALDFDIEAFRSVFDRRCLENVNRLCREFDLKIVVSSSWRNESDYQDMLRDNGLGPDIEILGKTPELYIGREKEILAYLKEHINIDRFIILDDTPLTELKAYHVQTSFSEGGFNDEKYEEARRLLKRQRGNH